MKIDATLKEAILKDKTEMTTKQLQDKYGVSRSSIQRIKLPDLEARASEFKPLSESKDEQVVEIVQRIQEIPVATQEPQAPPPNETIQRILLNADTFPAHYPFITDKSAFVASLSGQSPAQLANLLQTMEHTRKVNNLSAQMKQVFFVVSRATETLGARIHLKTQGLTDALMQQQQELEYIFKELAIDYADRLSTTTRPELKLAMTFGMAVLMVDSKNRIRSNHSDL